ncbi:MAG: LysR family transcriptional regulator [Burkholderiales bacterium]|nr:LysR family transcriptional regulator [Burkholderiales bacterium]
MDLRALRMFVEVVRQQGFSRAASTVFATQPTVSKAVKQLEEEIGFLLLDRMVSPPSLTIAGEVVFRRAVAMLAERDSLISELAELRGLRQGVLRIGFPPVGADVLFAPVFTAYRRRYPGIDIRLTEQGSKRLEELIVDGELDIAASLLPVSQEFDWQDVRREPLDLLVAHDHPLARRSTVSIAELRDVPLILFSEGFALNPIILGACRRNGFEPNIATRSSQISFILELVAGGLGVGFLPRMVASQREHAGVRNIGITDPDLVWHIALIWRRGGYLSHAAQAWVELIREAHAVQ